MHEDLIKALVGMNIPLNNIDHPLFRAFLKEHVEGGSTVPSGSWVRRDMIPKIYEKEKAQIKASFEGVDVAVLADESTDVENRNVLNVLLKALIPDSKAILISVDFLEKVNASEVAQTIQRSLVDYNVEYQQVRVFVSDNAAYMKVTFKVMKGFYVNMIHVTCWCHILSLVGNCWKDNLVSLDRLVACTKAIFVKSPARRRTWRALLREKNCEVKAFPIPVTTRWNSWFESVKYLAVYYNVFCDFIQQECVELMRSAKFDELKELVMQSTVHTEILFVGKHCSRIQRDLISMETACPSQVG